MDMRPQLSPSQQQELFALLLGELQGMRDAALADGADPAVIDEIIDQRRRALDSDQQ
jgi:hypothetical protein